MPISVRCECGRELLARDEAAGLHTQCPDCGRDLVIPGPKPTGAPRASSPDPMEWGPGPVKGGEPTTSGKAIASLVLGLVSIFLCLNLFAGIPAIILGALGLSETSRSQGQVKGRGMALTGLITGILGSLVVPVLILVALLLPAVQAAREAARRAQCTNNLKQIGLAMHNFHEATGHLPPAAITDAQGQPLLSWRVAILPYIEQQALYNQFKLDEPWDSPHNRALMSQMPRTFACPSEPDLVVQATTTYQVLVGTGTMFDAPQGVSFTKVTDGLSNTLMVVESGRPVPWTKPDDLPYGGPNQPLPAFDSKHPGGFNALFGDGSVRFVKKSINPTTLDAVITRAGGEVVSGSDY